MCSQFESVISIANLAKYTNSVYVDSLDNIEGFASHIYPHIKAPVIIKENNVNKIVFMTYSLVPYWSKSSNLKFATYNARLDREGKNNMRELIYNLPTWKKPFEKQHCIVPLAAFYESCHQGSHAGYIVKFAPNNPEQILFAARIWDKWTDLSTGEIVYSFAIITDEPELFIIEVGHDRQPVFLNLSNTSIWLNNDLTSTENYNFLKNNQERINYLVSDYRKLKVIKNDIAS